MKVILLVLLCIIFNLKIELDHGSASNGFGLEINVALWVVANEVNHPHDKSAERELLRSIGKPFMLILNDIL